MAGSPFRRAWRDRRLRLISTLFVLALVALIAVVLNLRHSRVEVVPSPTPSPSFLLTRVEQCGNLVISPPWVCVGRVATAQYNGAEGIAWSEGYPLVVPGERYGPDTFFSEGDTFCQGSDWGGFCVRGDYQAREYLATRVTVASPSSPPEQQAP